LIALESKNQVAIAPQEHPVLFGSITLICIKSFRSQAVLIFLELHNRLLLSSVRQTLPENSVHLLLMALDSLQEIRKKCVGESLSL